MDLDGWQYQEGYNQIKGGSSLKEGKAYMKINLHDMRFENASVYLITLI